MLSRRWEGEDLTEIARLVVLSDACALLLCGVDNGYRFRPSPKFSKRAGLKTGQSDRRNTTRLRGPSAVGYETA